MIASYMNLQAQFVNGADQLGGNPAGASFKSMPCGADARQPQDDPVALKLNSD